MTTTVRRSQLHPFFSSSRRRRSSTTLAAVLGLATLSSCTSESGTTTTPTTTAPAAVECSTQLTVGLAPAARIDAAHTFFSVGSPTVLSECAGLMTVCVGYANPTTAAANLTEPDISFIFGAKGGAVRYDTPYPTVVQIVSSTGVTTTEWCRSFDPIAAKATAPLYFAAQANFAPPGDGSLDVSVKSTMHFTPGTTATHP